MPIDPFQSLKNWPHLPETHNQDLLVIHHKRDGASMYLSREFLLLILLILSANLSACQSMVTHEYGAKTESGATTSSTFVPEPLVIPDPDHKKIELLKEEPIGPIHSSDTSPILTPASYYHSPDPPEEIPEYVPSLFFDFDSWTLTSKGKHILELTATQLKEDRKSSLIIEGHCDGQGAAGYNLVLGDKRARTIQDYLVSLGIAKNRLIPVSFGDTHPVCFENNETCHALNRRGYLVPLTNPQ